MSAMGDEKALALFDTLALENHESEHLRADLELGI